MWNSRPQPVSARPPNLFLWFHRYYSLVRKGFLRKSHLQVAGHACVCTRHRIYSTCIWSCRVSVTVSSHVPGTNGSEEAAVYWSLVEGVASVPRVHHLPGSRTIFNVRGGFLSRLQLFGISCISDELWDWVLVVFWYVQEYIAVKLEGIRDSLEQWNMGDFRVNQDNLRDCVKIVRG